MRIAFAVVAHEKPPLVERLIRNLVAEGHSVAVHYDWKSPEADFQRLQQAFAGCEAVRFARRVSVAWAEWSIVEATLNCLEAIDEAGWEPDYVYLLSGMDYPIRPSAELVAFLDRNRGYEFIQSVPADTERWVKTGPQAERYRYRFYFNWRRQPRLCRWSLWLQKKLGLQRRFVRDLTPYIGSQWWVLTWRTLKQIMELARQPDIRRFFSTVLVPDELFFQTMVRQVAPDARILNRALTLHQFTDYGWPLVFHADHAEFLMRQPFFVARKLSPYETGLRDTLDRCWRGEQPAQQFCDDDFGTTGPEYEDWRQAYRDGPPGQPVVFHPPDRRSEALQRLVRPYFAIIGTSTAELGLIHRALSRHPEILCHGQLFHPRRIEFAAGLPAFAGYRAEDLPLRDFSPASFLADVIRAEPQRLSGFLLRWGQGRQIPEVLFERPNAKLVLLRGDVLVSFSENIRGIEPTLDHRLETAPPPALPPSALANRFRRFLREFQQHSEWLAWLAGKAADLKAKGWIVDLDGAPAAPPAGLRLPSDPARARGGERPAETSLARWRGWTAQLQHCLGIELTDDAGAGELPPEPPRSPAEVALRRWHGRQATVEGGLAIDLSGFADALSGDEASAEMERLEERCRILAERLVAGGINPVVFDILRHHGPDGPRLAAALV